MLTLLALWNGWEHLPTTAPPRLSHSYSYTATCSSLSGDCFHLCRPGLRQSYYRYWTVWILLLSSRIDSIPGAWILIICLAYRMTRISPMYQTWPSCPSQAIVLERLSMVPIIPSFYWILVMLLLSILITISHLPWSWWLLIMLYIRIGFLTISYLY